MAFKNPIQSVRVMSLSICALVGLAALAGCSSEDSESSDQTSNAANQGEAGTGGSAANAGSGGTTGAEPTFCEPGELQDCDLPGQTEIYAAYDRLGGVAICNAEGSAFGECAAIECLDNQHPVLCAMADGSPGARKCVTQSNPETGKKDALGMTACYPTDECKPNETANCPAGTSGGTAPCVLDYEGRWKFSYLLCDYTPLVLSFSHAPVEFTRASGSFDLHGAEMSTSTAWVSAQTPWLVLDLDDNGTIDDGREMFGSMTILPNQSRAKNGFEALAQYDSNHDGWLSADDSIWPKLRLWSDINQDRTSQPSELQSVAAAGIESIALRAHSTERCDAAHGACERMQASMTFTDRLGRRTTGAVIDVFFRTVNDN